MPPTASLPVLSLLALGGPGPVAQEPIAIERLLAVESLGARSRSPYSTDELEARLALGTFTEPAEGDELPSTTGERRRWAAYLPEEDGAFRGPPFGGGWAFAAVEVPVTGPWCLEVVGPLHVLVDGEPHYGDPYGAGWTRLPLHLEAGRHRLLFRCGRGRLEARLAPAPAPVFLEERDLTLPDLLRGEDEPQWLGVIVSNASDRSREGLRLRTRLADGGEAVRVLPPLLPSSFRKCGVRLPALVGDPEAETLEVELLLEAADGTPLHRLTRELALRSPNELHRRTFTSAIDGSVQYYAVRPPSAPPAAGTGELVLTLHGAGVEAWNQARCYRPRPGAWIVAPTNRRPFGFDWEDWGRRDALEVLALAQARFGTDPRRTFLTGHSMGGHGTWQLGAHFPDRFAAIAPSAGWRDFQDYGGTRLHPEDPVGRLLDRAASPSRTLRLERNYLHGGVYVLHGDADETVPVSEARAMRERLAAFHPDFAYYERPGAGHWWGDECMDWPPLMEFLGRHRSPASGAPDAFAFRTAHPGISSRCHWVEVVAVERWLEPARVEVRHERDAARIELTTENVEHLAVDPVVLRMDEGEGATRAAPVRFVIDGQELEPALPEAGRRWRFARDGAGAWRSASRPAAARKGPHRSGPFKEAFGREMVFVYGTRGSAEENAWARDKARFDHETWRYRGNGAVEVIPDHALGGVGPDRSIVLYGNADTNGAWEAVLGDPPFSLTRDALAIDGRELVREDLAFLAVRPRQGSDVASVAVVGGTGLPGCRTTDFLAYFVSGVAYPDWTVLATESLRVGVDGILGAGFFATDWSLGPGAESAWR